MTDTGSYEEFLADHEELIESLAGMGWTPAEAYHRVTTVYPHAPAEYVLQAINSGRWTFVGRKEQLFSNTMTAAALWYAVAVSYDLPPEPDHAAVTLDPVIIEDVPRLLDLAGVTRENTAIIINKVGAGLKYLAENPYTTLEESAYDEMLENLPPEAIGISDEVNTWPPTRFIVEDRLGDGSWSQALLRVGICPTDFTDRGLSLSGSELSDRSFRNTLGEFLSYCIRYDRKPSVLLYGSWAVSQSQYGRVPVLGAVRAKYGTWYRALRLGRRMINDALKMSNAQAVPASPPREAAGLSGLAIDEIKAQGIGVVETPRLSEPNVERQAWTELNEAMASRLQELPWGQSLRVYYLSEQVLAAEDFTPYARIMRSPGGWLCEVSAAESFSRLAPTIDERYLQDNGWNKSAHNGFIAYSQNFFEVSQAAFALVGAMRYGQGCQYPEYFQSDDPANFFEADGPSPDTGAFPIIPNS